MGQKIKCLHCNDVIESLHRHDLHPCSCKAIYIDGGNDYTRIGGNPEDYVFVEKT